MPIIVHSPHSGRPVKIRDQDVGRAIRDEEGRIFYAVPRSDGKGYYGSLTRQGSAKDEERYAEMLAKESRAHDVAQQRLAEAGVGGVHDATGVSRGGGARRAVFLVILLAILAALGYVAVVVFDVEVPGLNDGGGINLPAPEGPSLPEPTEPIQLPEQGPPQPSRGPDVWRELQAVGTLFDEAEPLYSVDESEAEAETKPAIDAPEVESSEEVAAIAAPAVAVPATPPAPPQPPFVTTGSGLKYRILQHAPPGAATATAGSYVLIHYTAKLPTGQVIDTSHAPGYLAGRADSAATQENADAAGDAAPIAFVLWSGQVIRGWDEGIAGMKVGELREIVVPPHLITATPQTGSVGFPAGSAVSLHFDIELVDVLPGVLQTTTHAGTVGGDVAAPGDTLRLHYRAFLHDPDTLFDDSRQRPGGGPFRIRLGAREVILGLELGLAGMKEGERRTLVIPPYLAYGRRGVGTVIPPDATLRYEIELVDVE